jgi:hypothetical protein
MSEQITPSSFFADLTPIMRSMAMGHRVQPTPYFERLEQAIRDQFPGVECGTFKTFNLMSSFPVSEVKTSWWKAGTDYEELSSYKARQVKAFCAGWVKGHRDCEDGLTAPHPDKAQQTPTEAQTDQPSSPPEPQP